MSFVKKFALLALVGALVVGGARFEYAEGVCDQAAAGPGPALDHPACVRAVMADPDDSHE